MGSAHPVRVALVAGAHPPRQCGAEDFTVNLAEAMKKDGLEVRVFGGGGRSILRTPDLRREISGFRPHVVHLQYPTMGYGKSLVPQALTAFMSGTPLVTTLHEFSTSHLLRKVADLPFALRSGALVFTNEHESRHFSSWFPWARKKSLVIPIGSNVPFLSGSVVRDPLRVVYFGLIRPHKGLEEFLALASLARDSGRPYRFAIVGEVAARYGSYPEDLRTSAEGLNVEWRIGLSTEEASRYLAGSRFSYAPFPDGASERRGSLLAVMGNGAVVITTRGTQTPEGLSEAALFAESPSRALELLDELTTDADRADTLSSRARGYAARSSWTSISRAHIHLYERILGGKP